MLEIEVTNSLDCQQFLLVKQLLRVVNDLWLEPLITIVKFGKIAVKLRLRFVYFQGSLLL